MAEARAVGVRVDSEYLEEDLENGIDPEFVILDTEEVAGYNKCGAADCNRLAYRWCTACTSSRCRQCIRREDPAKKSLGWRVPSAAVYVCRPCALERYRKWQHQELGACESMTSVFRSKRDRWRQMRSRVGYGSQVVAACKRLASACEASSVSSATATTAAAAATQSLAALLVEPEWTRTNITDVCKSAGATAKNCPADGRKFGVVWRRHYCRLCGGVRCDKCLFRSLQVFRQQDVLAETGTGTTTVLTDLLRPGEQNTGATVLRACNGCLDQMQHELDGVKARAAASVVKSQGTGGDAAPVPPEHTALVAAYTETMQLRNEIDTTLAEFRDNVELLSDTASAKGVESMSPTTRTPSREASGSGDRRVVGVPRAASSSSSKAGTEAGTEAGAATKVTKKGTVRVVAKHQASLSTLFAEFTNSMFELRRTGKAGSLLHARVVDSVFQAQATFNREQAWSFHALKKQLEEAIPPAALAASEPQIKHRTAPKSGFERCVFVPAPKVQRSTDGGGKTRSNPE